MITGETLEEMGYSYYDRDPFPTTYPTPMEYVKNYYTTAGIEPDPLTCGQLVAEEFDEWFQEWFAHEEKYPEKELKELADLVFTVYGYALSRGFDLNEAFSRVAKNNLQRMVWDDGLIHRDDNGKVLKSPTAAKVNLSDLV